MVITQSNIDVYVLFQRDCAKKISQHAHSHKLVQNHPVRLLQKFPSPVYGNQAHSDIRKEDSGTAGILEERVLEHVR
jgi:hypothetical protein